MASSIFYFSPNLIYNRVLYLSSKLLRMCSAVQLQKPTFLFFRPPFPQFEFFLLFIFLDCRLFKDFKILVEFCFVHELNAWLCVTGTET
jgi:hypothetical protein